MLRTTLVVTTTVLLFLSLAMGYQLSRTSDADYKLYEKLTVSSNPEKAISDETIVSHQSRQAPEKNIWFSKQHQRLHFRLYAENSELVYSRNYDLTEVVEKLENVHCYMQEELFYVNEEGKDFIIQPNGRLLQRNSSPDQEKVWLDIDHPGLRAMQRIRFLQADQAFYYYKTNRFIAESVHLQRYLLEGHNLTEALDRSQMVMDGKAEQVEFTLEDKDVNFRAKRLNATFFSPRGSL
ncbi:MAG: hypothetical protein CMO81_11525 [Waddliaceae bacterium]|nr:hypothetical protein [Waddliaceae bacterium]